MIEYDSQKFYEGLVANKLIIPGGVQGAFGRGTVFEDVLEGLNRQISHLAKDDGAETMVFPPVIDRRILEKVDYFDSFPQLGGAVFSFFGKDAQAKELSRRSQANEKYDELLGMTDVVLNPAACYPVYPTLAGSLPKDGRLITMLGWVYRHEPSPEPTRMQSFRVREFIRAGTPEMVVSWRDMWLERGVKLLTDLELPAKADVASDPFFGRGGKMLAAGQLAQKLKFEVLVPVISAENPTACCSFNYHQEKFGGTFDIKTDEGEVAHTACLGFGMERVVMALFKAHGFDPGKWPSAVYRRFWP